MESSESAFEIVLPPAPALVAGNGRILWLRPDGEILEPAAAEAADKARRHPPLLCHRPALARRLNATSLPGFDLLELFAFVRPARFCLPTPAGLAEALGLRHHSAAPFDLADAALALVDSARKLLEELASLSPRAHVQARSLIGVLAQAGWNWTPYAAAALGVGEAADEKTAVRLSLAGLRIWDKLPEWSEHAPEPPGTCFPVEPAEARAKLAEILGSHAEDRPQQADYASAVTAAFAPRAVEDQPHLVLAEAGTGVGKTLGYLAPAGLWASKNEQPVWVSTFTRNLQRQIDGELDRLFPDLAEKSRKVVIRKGRENYLCLLNFEEAAERAAARGVDGLVLALLARWALASRDGDVTGGDLPGWLPELLGRSRVAALADRRGECIHSACPHYHKCFIERAVRKARRADIVIANHALVLIQAALGGLDDGYAPDRLIFDEGHHLFDAADAAFAVHLTGAETAELRRWLLGSEEGRSRARGLKKRIGDLAEGRDELARALDEILASARALPGPGWAARLKGGQPLGPAESFFATLRGQVLARAEKSDPFYGQECDLEPINADLLDAAIRLDAALVRLRRPLGDLIKALGLLLDDEAADLDTGTRNRIEAAMRGLERRGANALTHWRAMLKALAGERRPEYVDWLALEKDDGQEMDVGMHRHWLDPTFPLAEAVLRPAHGVLVTSATLRDGSGVAETDWQAAEARSGANHLLLPAVRAQVTSPFDYKARTRVLIVGDVNSANPDQQASAFRELFLASGGGALGLFTAISRLRAVRERIQRPLEAAGLPLLAQHADGMEISTLLDIFRAEENACLLGTDAARDGVDVPGRSLRLIVFERTPWSRPDILHRARRKAMGGAAYEDMLTRLRLKQAFGRLIRRSDDMGVFVLLDKRLPSRLLGAFPDGVPIQRLGLADAVSEVRAFLGPAGAGA